MAKKKKNNKSGEEEAMENNAEEKLDKTVSEEKPETKVVPETPKKKEIKPLIDIDGYCASRSLRFTTRARLEHYVQQNKLQLENTIDEWDKITKKL